jgi:integrase
MSLHKQSHSIAQLASTVLPAAKVIQLEPNKRTLPTVSNSFTKNSINRMRCPPGRSEAFFWDASCRGFGLRVLKSGCRSWVFQYRDEHSRTRRIALGDVSAVGLDAGREAARQLAAKVTQGGNPSVERRRKRQAANVLDLVQGYLGHAVTRQRSRTYKETERHLLQHAAPLHHERVEAVHRRDIAELLEKVAKRSGPIAANRVRAALSALWSWGLRSGLIEADSNPVAFTVRNPERTRERVLNDAELRAIWDATNDNADYSRIVRLCLLTGCRREEIGSLRWDEVQADRIVFGPDRMKGNLAHEIALLPMIAAILPKRPEQAEGCVFGKRGTGFSGWSKSKKTLDAALTKAGVKMPAWGLHDLRRTFSTSLHDAGVEPIVIEALLAHKQQGVAAVYNRASFREAKRTALMRWHGILTANTRPMTPSSAPTSSSARRLNRAAKYQDTPGDAGGCSSVGNTRAR